MKRKLNINLIWAILIFLLFSIPAYAEWWEKIGEPQYGGILTVRVDSLSTNTFDPAVHKGPQNWQYHFEQLFMNNWAVDRSIWPFNAGFIPAEYHKGLLAEGWEQPDPKKIIVSLRKGIHWQNKPPVNGRELTAYDVQYTYDRLLGTGSGFTDPNPFFSMMLSNVARVTAKDKYTLVFELKEENSMGIYQVIRPEESGPGIVAQEWVEQGNLENWKNAVGSGPWMVSGFIEGSSLTFSRNPDYNRSDERHTGNRLPYIESLKLVEIPNTTTAIAAMRTGKIDIMRNLTWQEEDMLLKTNPDIQKAVWLGPSSTLDLRCDKKPFNDIRVRKALQMSINIKEIADTIYGGLVEGMACGLISPTYKGYVFPYNEWSEELKSEYNYNKDNAKKLLAEAGYPQGFDTNCIVSSSDNINLLQAIKSYFSDIGVNMEIKEMDPAVFEAMVRTGKHDQMSMATWAGLLSPPDMSLAARFSKCPVNWTYNNDKKYDGLFREFNSATNIDKAKKLCIAMDKYTLEQHWAVSVCPTVDPIVWQPWVKGYSGEGCGMGGLTGVTQARLWIDQKLKRSLGY